MRGVFFYSSIFSSASEIGSSSDNSEDCVFVDPCVGGGFLDWFSKFLFKALKRNLENQSKNPPPTQGSTKTQSSELSEEEPISDADENIEE